MPPSPASSALAIVLGPMAHNGSMLLEHNDEWAVQRARYMTLETMAPLSVRQVFDPPDQILIFLTPMISLPVVAR